MSAPTARTSLASPARGLGPVIALGVTTLAIVCVLSSIGLGPGGSALAGILAAASTILHAGLFALAYLLGAIGLGRPLAAVVARGLPSRIAIQAALGVGLMLWLSHLLGVLGLLSGDGIMPRLVAWSVVAAGLALLLHQLVRGDLEPERWPALPWPAVLFAPALALVLVAAANAPGWLWQSEFGAYDALSYHLQLPKEWAAASALAPSEHNVYSYLPGYVEAAYLHLGQMMIGGAGGTEPIERMLGGDGVWVLACQSLHAALGLLAALLCGRGAWAVARAGGADPRISMTAGIGAALLVLGTGWTVVCASLAYNEMGVLAASAGALLLCVDRADGAPAAGESPGHGALAPWLRGAGVGFLVGVAASCKPTALLLIGPCAGLLLLHGMPRRGWPGVIAAGTIAGLIALAPWLIRNALASGNPVFPFAADTLGLGHWTSEQAARHARAHAFDGPLADRFALLFSGRGWLHAHWGATPWICLGLAVLALVRGRAQRLTLVLLAGVGAGVAAWLVSTHLQSRFLLPLLAPMSLALGVAAPAAGRSGRAPPTMAPTIAAATVYVLCAVPSGLALLGFVSERAGQPNMLLVGGVGEQTGQFRLTTMLADLDPAAQAEVLRRAAGPTEFINLAIQPASLGPEARAAVLHPARDLAPGEPSRVYLLGDATPLYLLGATGDAAHAPVIYHTTWDRSPLGDAIRAAPDGPAAWTAHLRARGIGFVLVNFDELGRLIALDRNFDPDVTLERIATWLTDPGAGCVAVHAWPRPGAGPGTGGALFRLFPPAAERAR